MEFISMVAMSAAIPEVAYDLSISSVLMALVAVVFGIGALAAFNVRRKHQETANRRRPTSHLKMVQRPAFGAAH